jgi:alpha-tubulin suppressor-like RCC1 family protein
MGIQIGFINSSGSDIGLDWVEKSYIIDRYPELEFTFKQAGLWVWGNNVYGQLGTNDIIRRSSPGQTVAGGTNWREITAGYIVSSGIKTDGTLWTWGRNNEGQLGTNNNLARSSPGQTISGGTNWKKIEMGTGATAIKTDGTLWTWGSNVDGVLGTNDTLSRSSPGQTVAGGTNWKQVCESDDTTSAIYFYDAGNLYPSY